MFLPLFTRAPSLVCGNVLKLLPSPRTYIDTPLTFLNEHMARRVCFHQVSITLHPRAKASLWTLLETCHPSPLPGCRRIGNEVSSSIIRLFFCIYLFHTLIPPDIFLFLLIFKSFQWSTCLSSVTQQHKFSSMNTIATSSPHHSRSFQLVFVLKYSHTSSF